MVPRENRGYCHQKKGFSERPQAYSGVWVRPQSLGPHPSDALGVPLCKEKVVLRAKGIGKTVLKKSH